MCSLRIQRRGNEGRKRERKKIILFWGLSGTARFFARLPAPGFRRRIWLGGQCCKGVRVRSKRRRNPANKRGMEIVPSTIQGRCAARDAGCAGAIGKRVAA